MDFIQEFSRAVREHRKRKNLTLEQLAEKTQVSVSTIKNIENGTSANPGMDTVFRLSDALDIPIYIDTEPRPDTLLAGIRYARKFITSLPGDVVKEPTLNIISALENCIETESNRH